MILIQPMQEKVFWNTIDKFAQLDLLKHIVIIGSWAEYLYHKAGILPGFSPNLRTMDMDAVLNNIRRPVPNVNISEEMKKLGYQITVRTIDGLVKFTHPDQLELEIMVLEKGRGQSAPYDVTTLGIKATGLRLSLLTENTLCLNLSSSEILVPTPQAYILHKLEIDRGNAAKEQKDMDAVREILRVIKLMPSEKQKLLELFDSLNKKSKSKIKEKCSVHHFELF